MKKPISILLILLITLPVVLAQEDTTGIMPDSPIYFIKRIGEKIGYFIQVTPEKKVRYEIMIADRRLNEIESMVNKNRMDIANRATLWYQKSIAHAQKLIAKQKDKTKFDDLLEQHKTRADNLGSKISEIAKNSPDKATKIESIKDLIKEKVKAIHTNKVEVILPGSKNQTEIGKLEQAQAGSGCRRLCEVACDENAKDNVILKMCKDCGCEVIKEQRVIVTSDRNQKSCPPGTTQTNFCSDEYVPVCANGLTFTNACVACSSKEIYLYSEGECE